jgi:3-phosphoglycerate kinase
MGCQDRNGTLIIGGELSGDKLLAIDQLSGHLSSIVLLGKLGLAFYLTMYEIQSDIVSEAVREVIRNLLNVLKDESAEKPPQRLTRISHLPQ